MNDKTLVLFALSDNQVSYLCVRLLRDFFLLLFFAALFSVEMAARRRRIEIRVNYIFSDVNRN